MIFYSYNCFEDVGLNTLDIAKKSRRGRPIREFPETLQLLYPYDRKLSKEKIQDLQSLLKFVPLEHHQFYMNLQGEEEGTSAQAKVIKTQ